MLKSIDFFHISNVRNTFLGWFNILFDFLSHHHYFFLWILLSIPLSCFFHSSSQPLFLNIVLLPQFFLHLFEFLILKIQHIFYESFMGICLLLRTNAYIIIVYEGRNVIIIIAIRFYLWAIWTTIIRILCFLLNKVFNKWFSSFFLVFFPCSLDFLLSFHCFRCTVIR